jgi:hypothetical protein
MKITGETNVSDLLKINEETMLRTLAWLAPDIGRLQSPAPLRTIIGCVSVEQAARIARIPLAEALYVLNLAAGEEEDTLAEELRERIGLSPERSPRR